MFHPMYKWMLLFGSAFIVSRRLFFHYYYPRLIKLHVSCLSAISVMMNDSIMLANMQHLAKFKSTSINDTSNTMPLINIEDDEDSIFDDSKRWYYSNEAAEKVISFFGAALTIYNGYKIIKACSITTNSIKRFDNTGANNKSIEKQIIKMISCNIGYVTIDSLILMFSPCGKNKNFLYYIVPYLLHHLFVIVGGITILNDKSLFGSKLWTFTYFYSDLATIWLWISWFSSNYLKNAKIIKESIMSEVNDINADIQSKAVQIFDESHAISAVNKCNTVTSLLFGGLFLKNRIITFTLTLPYWMISCYKSPNTTQMQKNVSVLCVGGILGIEYIFCWRVLKDAWKIVSTKKKIHEVV
eukprot:441086_1